MSLVAIEGLSSTVDEQHPALHVVGLPRFLYLANYHLDAGLNMEKVAQLMQAQFAETFHKNFGRPVGVSDVQLARDYLHHRVPTPALRFEMTRWALTLSKEFRRAAGFVCKNNPAYDQNEANLLTQNFAGYLSKRSHASGYLLKASITPDDVISSYVLYPEGCKGAVRPDFATAEAAIFEFCTLVPYRDRDRSILAYAEHFGQGELIERLRLRCMAACASPLSGFMSAEQKAAHAKHGEECFWTLIEYINWLVNNNPMDVR